MLQNQAKLAPRFKDLQSRVAHCVTQREKVSKKGFTIFVSEITKVTPLSEKPANSLIISEFNGLICSYNLLISLDLSEIS